MDAAKVYQDSEGKDRSLDQMVQWEPYWAANRIREGETAIERVKVLEDSDKVFRRVIEKIIADNNGMTPGWLLDLVP